MGAFDDMFNDDDEWRDLGREDARAGRTPSMVGHFLSEEDSDRAQRIYDYEYGYERGLADGREATLFSDIAEGMAGWLLPHGHSDAAEEGYERGYKEGISENTFSGDTGEEAGSGGRREDEDSDEDVEEDGGNFGNGGGSGGGGGWHYTGGTEEFGARRSTKKRRLWPWIAFAVIVFLFIYGLFESLLPAFHEQPAFQAPEARHQPTEEVSSHSDIVDAGPAITVGDATFYEGLDSDFNPLPIADVLYFNHQYGLPFRGAFAIGFDFKGMIPSTTRMRVEVHTEGREVPQGWCQPDKRFWRPNAWSEDWIAPQEAGRFICRYQGNWVPAGRHVANVYADGELLRSFPFSVAPPSPQVAADDVENSNTGPEASRDTARNDFRTLRPTAASANHNWMPRSFIGKWTGSSWRSAPREFVDVFLIGGRINTKVGVIGYRANAPNIQNVYDACFTALILKEATTKAVLVEEILEDGGKECPRSRMIMIDFSDSTPTAIWFEGYVHSLANLPERRLMDVPLSKYCLAESKSKLCDAEPVPRN